VKFVDGSQCRLYRDIMGFGSFMASGVSRQVPLGVIFFAHGAQKMFGWFDGYGWHGTMQYFTQSLHIPAPLAAVAILVELLGGLAW
jgi:putative oxidoreductase